MSDKPLVVAVPKGRILKPLSKLLGALGIEASALLADDRTLVRRAGGLEFLLLKPDDVPTYVEYGAADLGICGRDVLRERECDVLVPLDLRIGRCRTVVAAPVARTARSGVPRVATKYPRTAAAHFAAKGVQAEIIYVQGSVELAPLVGLAEMIVDLVETGETLVQNGLEIIEVVAEVSTVLVANRASYKLLAADVAPLIERLRAAIGP